MKVFPAAILLLCFIVVAPIQAQRTRPNDVPAEELSPGDPGDNKPSPVAVNDGTVKITPENSKVDFVGTHVGEEPNPRLGGFEKFNGQMTMDGSTPKSMNLEFDTTSLWTEIGANLTNHLKNEDFLDVEKFPTAKFESTSIEATDEPNIYKVTGDFTLMDKTNEISFPAKVTTSDEGVLVSSEFKFDRTEFGMDKMTDRVAADVAIKLSIGEKTSRPNRPGGRGQMAGGRGQGGRGQGGRNFDPAVMFRQADADGNGKLSGDEIPEFMKSRMEMFDTDEDGAISLEELQARMRGRGGRGGPPEGRGNRGGNDGGDRGGEGDGDGG